MMLFSTLKKPLIKPLYLSLFYLVLLAPGDERKRRAYTHVPGLFWKWYRVVWGELATLGRLLRRQVFVGHLLCVTCVRWFLLLCHFRVLHEVATQTECDMQGLSWGQCLRQVKGEGAGAGGESLHLDASLTPVEGEQEGGGQTPWRVERFSARRTASQAKAASPSQGCPLESHLG